MAINLLNQKIGIIGGGQLGKMMILEAKRLGFYITILDPNKDCPAHSIADYHIVSSFDDEDAIALLSEKSDIITYEFEHINANALLNLENIGKKVYPSPKSLKIIQNKFEQKLTLKSNDVPIPDFLMVNTFDDLKNIHKSFSYPFLLKTCIGGYDGKGNYVVKSNEDIETAYETLGSGKIPLMAERFIDFKMEISVLACRDIVGNVEVFPVAKNTHIDNILELTLAPAPISNDLTNNAMEIAKKVLHIFEGVGTFCIEMFISKDDNIYVNEVAPRPHNSGHYTIEACVTNQFEQHIRAITSLPLGSAEIIRPVAMRNLLGEEGYSGEAYVRGIENALSIEGVKVHLYGKSQTLHKRKMGHITVCADSLEKADKLCCLAKSHIKIISK